MSHTVRWAPPVMLLLTLTGAAFNAYAEPPAPSKRTVVPGVVLGVLAAASFGAGIGLMNLSESTRADAMSLSQGITAERGTCVVARATYDPFRCPTLQSKLRTEDAEYNVAEGLFVAGGAAAAAMFLYLLWPAPREPLRLMPLLSPTSHGLLVSGTF